MRKNEAGQYLTFGLVDRSSGAPLTGVSPAVYLILDDAAQVATVNAAESMGNGQYRVLLTQTETNADTIGFVALVGTAVLAEKTIYTVSTQTSPPWSPPPGAGKTVKDCIAEARWILQDIVPIQGSVRYPDAHLLEYFNNALYEVRRIRPDLYVGSFGQTLPYYTDQTWDQGFPLSMMYWAPVVQYIAGYAELRDDEFTVDGRASILLNKFREQLTMVA